MESVIFQKNNVLNENLCDDLINMFELNKIQHKKGITLGGLDPTIKDTYDIVFSNTSSEYWSKCSKLIISILYDNLKEWRKRFELSVPGTCALPKHLTLNKPFILQKYEKNCGQYIYHNDFSISNSREYRVATFIFYLNTVEQGGETEFMDKFRIKPAKGKLVLFPATWFYYHRGKMPISDNKYIITGWLYNDEFVQFLDN